MKKILAQGMVIAIGALLCAFPARAEIFSLQQEWEMTLKQKIGAVSYREKTGGVNDAWDSTIYRTDVSIDTMRDTQYPLKVKANVGYLVSAKDSETWNSDGLYIERNVMGMTGINPGLELGYQFRDLLPQGKLTLTPLFGYGYKNINYKRAASNRYVSIDSRATASEGLAFHYLDVGTYLDYALDHDWSFMSRFSFSPVLADAIDNSDSGRIKGKGGYLFNANLGFDYRLTEYSSIAFGGFMELQHLKGNTRDAAIWPTNDTNSYGIFVAMNGFWGAGTRSVRSARQEEPVVRQVAVPAQPARVMPARPSARVELVCAPETVTYDPGDYYEEVRKKIASCVAGMSKLDKGETQLHLTLAADGAIEKVYAIDETSTTGAVTKQAIVQAVTALTPFPALPKELKKNKISMIVPVVVS